MPRQHVENTKEFSSENEAKRANKHANKRIIYWAPFWNKVYKDIQGHLRSFGAGLADSSIKNEAELLLSRAGKKKSFMYLFILLWVNNFSGGSLDRITGGFRRVRPHPTLIFKPN